MPWLTNVLWLFLGRSILSFAFWLSIVGYFAYSVIKR